MSLLARQLKLVITALILLVVLASVGVWGQHLSWRFDRLSAYSWFPLFGLMAFGLMWGHYVIAVLSRVASISEKTSRQYFEITSLAVLALIILHPGLLIFQLWNDGFGLPPGSYLEHYVAPSLKWAAFLGSISLIVFLIYELRRWFRDKKWWVVINYANDIAMFAIIIHGFQLGMHIQSGWFRYVWIFYALTFLICIVIKYRLGDRKGEA